jgi:hypothetical protein
LKQDSLRIQAASSPPEPRVPGIRESLEAEERCVAGGRLTHRSRRCHNRR